MEVTCQCGSRVAVGDKFCRHCGDGILLSGVKPPECGDAEELCSYARRLAEYSRALRQNEPLSSERPAGIPTLSSGRDVRHARGPPSVADRERERERAAPNLSMSRATVSSSEIKHLAQYIKKPSAGVGGGGFDANGGGGGAPRVLDPAALCSLRSFSLSRRTQSPVRFP